MKPRAATCDETTMTELEIAPDGRIYVFGASAAILKVLESVGLHGQAIDTRLQAAGAAMRRETSAILHD